MNDISRFNRIRLLCMILAVGSWLTLSACQGDYQSPLFDSVRAYDLLVRQTDMGPRDPGSQGWNRFQTFMASFFDSLGVEYERQPFDYYDYLKGDTLKLVNWIVRINPGASNRILLAAHYDCRPRAEHDPDSTLRAKPILGANDGASGTAVLMHLAELMAANPPRLGVDLVFFDGEDYGPPGRDDQYLLGSTHFASTHKTEYRFGLLLDMIGDRDLKIYREHLSELYAKEVNDRVWKAAAKLGIPQFVDSLKHEVLDDHIPLIGAGIKTADIIDFDYPYWHTQADTPDKCDPASLAAVGKVIIEVIYGE